MIELSETVGFAVGLAQSSIAGVLGIAGVTKLTRAREFQSAVRDYRLLSPSMARLFGLLLPPAEIAVAALLVFGSAAWQLRGGIAAITLFVMFSVAAVVNLLRGRRDIPCGCFHFGGNPQLSWRLVGRNLVMSALTVFGTLPQGTSPSSRVDVALTAAAILMIVALTRTVARFFVPAGGAHQGRGVQAA